MILRQMVAMTIHLHASVFPTPIALGMRVKTLMVDTLVSAAGIVAVDR